MTMNSRLTVITAPEMLSSAWRACRPAASARAASAASLVSARNFCGRPSVPGIGVMAVSSGHSPSRPA
jgi:hypothetical protein